MVSRAPFCCSRFLFIMNQEYNEDDKPSRWARTHGGHLRDCHRGAPAWNQRPRRSPFRIHRTGARWKPVPLGGATHEQPWGWQLFEDASTTTFTKRFCQENLALSWYIQMHSFVALNARTKVANLEREGTHMSSHTSRIDEDLITQILTCGCESFSRICIFK